MKALALMLLLLPLAAWAVPQDSSPVVATQFATAAATCTADHVTPADPKWGRCVNLYLQINYGYQLMPFANHLLAMVRVNSQFDGLRLVLPVPLPATVTSWKLPVRISAYLIQDGSGWCAGYWGLSYARACADRPDMAYAKFVAHTINEPKRWPHAGGEYIEPY